MGRACCDTLHACTQPTHTDRACAVEAWAALGPCPQGGSGLLASLRDPLAATGRAHPQALDLSTAFRPGALLSALAQQAARQAGVALGQLQLVACWSRGGGGATAHASPAPVAVLGDGASPLEVPVTGLLVQGALFDGGRLTPVQQVGVHSPATGWAAAPGCARRRRCSLLRTSTRTRLPLCAGLAPCQRGAAPHADVAAARSAAAAPAHHARAAVQQP
jgi:hypothetical protein